MTESNRRTAAGLTRRSVLGAGLSAGAGLFLGGCGGGGDSSDVQKLIDSPSDNLHKTGMPIVSKPVTVRYMTGRATTTASDWNQVAVWKKYQQMTNMTVDWGLVPRDAISDKRNLALSSGDYPEAFDTPSFSSLDAGKYGTQGVFVALNPMLDDYMPNLSKLMADNPEIKKGMTFPDGNIYGCPNVHDPDFLGLRIQFKLWVRGDWLDAFGMDIPTTTDEYYRYLKAVKTKQPNGSDEAIPYCDTQSTDSLRLALMGAFGVGNKGSTQSYIDQDPSSGKVRFYHIADEYKALIEFLHRLYSEGLIAKNIFSVDSAKFNNAAAKGVYGSNVTQAPGNYYGGKAKNFVSCPALKGPDGDHAYNYVSSALSSVANFVITDKSEHPVETARWIDYFYGDEGCKLFFMGVEGESYRETDDGVEYLDKITDNPDGLTLDQALKPYITWLGGSYPGIVKEDYFKGVESSKESTDAAKKLQPDAIDEVWPNFTYTEDEAQQLDSLTDDIHKYVDESRAKFITGEMPLDQWGSYVDKINQMGLEDLLTIQQDALDRYNKG